jgi:hypothetical protein
MKTLPKVAKEMALHVPAYGVKPMLVAVGA